MKIIPAKKHNNLCKPGISISPATKQPLTKRLLNFDFSISYSASRTTTEKGGNLTLSLPDLSAAFLNAAGVMAPGAEKEL